MCSSGSSETPMERAVAAELERPAAGKTDTRSFTPMLPHGFPTAFAASTLSQTTQAQYTDASRMRPRRRTAKKLAHPLTRRAPYAKILALSRGARMPQPDDLSRRERQIMDILYARAAEATATGSAAGG